MITFPSYIRDVSHDTVINSIHVTNKTKMINSLTLKYHNVTANGLDFAR